MKVFIVRTNFKKYYFTYFHVNYYRDINDIIFYYI